MAAYYTRYMRVRREALPPDDAERCQFDDATLARYGFARVFDGGILRSEALLIVNDWNRLAAEHGATWFYYIEVGGLR